VLDDPTDKILTQRFHVLFHDQIPKSFVVRPLPREVSSWILQILQIAASSMTPNKKLATRNETELSADGKASAKTQDSRMTYSSPISMTTKANWSSDHSFLATNAKCGRKGEDLRANVRHCTVREAAGHLATTFRHHFQPSPLHVSGSSHMHPTIRSLFKAFDNTDPPPNRQKAITPRLLRRMYSLSREEEPGGNTIAAVTADLAILGFFYAMRSCENTAVPIRGRTKLLVLKCIQYWDNNRRTIKHNDPNITLAQRVTITFVDQKNGLKMDSRTHERTKDQVLCPVRRAAALTKRILLTIPNANERTPINTVLVDGQILQITGNYLRDQLRRTCKEMGGKAVLGFDPDEIGTKSIRSGSAMALFLMNHAVHRIMILGRWYSEAFLVYIRPQVLEWTNNMSQDMIYLDSFFHLPDPTIDPQEDPRIRNNQSHFNGPASLLTPRLHLHH
jgi:hypothetical protein